MFVITLIAAAYAEDTLAKVVDTLTCGLQVQASLDWLASTVCELTLRNGDPTEVEAAARQAIGAAPIDVLVQPAMGRRKRLLVADLESTIIENEMLEELAEFVGLRRHVAEITRRAMNGELDFAAALRERVALLKGLPASVLDEAAARIRFMAGARTLLATARAAGMRTILVSGGFTVFAEPVAARLGFDQVIANRLDIVRGRLAGSVQPPIVTAQTKLETLRAASSKMAVPLSATLAVGDGANDLPMLQAAGLGIAFHAKPSVAAASRWCIDHADLTGLLYAQGYRFDEIQHA